MQGYHRRVDVVEIDEILKTMASTDGLAGLAPQACSSTCLPPDLGALSQV